MKKALSLFTSFLFCGFLFVIHAQPIVFHHQLNADDVAEINKLAAALNFSGLTGWPVSAEELPNSYPSYEGLGFFCNDTTVRTTEDQTIYVYHYRLKLIRIDYENFSGTLPELSLSELETFDLKFNKITGGIPTFNFPKCKHINFMGNQLTGSIPNMNYPELLYLNLAMNELSGTIPNLNLPKLGSLFLQDNNFEGSLPAFNMPELSYLYASNNYLSGDLPYLNLPKLQTLQLEENNLTGTLNALTGLSKLQYMWLTGNNFSGSIPQFNMPELINIALGQNELTGVIPVFNLPNLILLNVKENNLEGDFDNSGLPQLNTVYLQENEISGLPDLKNASPGLIIANVEGNMLTFEDLEPNMDIQQFKYYNQGKVPCFITVNGSNAEVWVEVGGSQNTYVWYKKTTEGSTKIEGATEDRLIILYEPGTSYYCYIRNSIVTGLPIYSEDSKLKVCLQTSNFEFCLTDGEWEDKEGNKTGASGRIIINDLLIFEGTLTLDTINLAMEATGEFFVENIPIANGNIGKFSFGSGTYELKLMGEDGMITEFLGAKMDELGQLCGIDLKLKNMQLVGGRNANGIKIDCMIGIPGIGGSCGDEDKNTEFEMKGLSITTEGISLDGVEVTDLGLFLKGYCLKKLTLAYDSKKDILTSGAEVALPFGTIGGGFKIEEGYLDSIAWLLEASTPPFVLGTTTIGIKGFRGHISSITKKNIEIELKGIFSDITSDKFYRIEAGGRTIWPAEFEISGDGEFIKPSLDDEFPFQLKGGVSVSYNIPDYLFKVKFNGNMGTLDSESWLIQSEGTFNMNLKNNPPVFSGELSGNIHINKFDDSWYYDWLNRAFTLPVNCQTVTFFNIGKTKIVNGEATFETEGIGPIEIKYIVDLDKTYGQEGFLDWELNAALKSVYLKDAPLVQEIQEQFTIPENSAFAVFGINSGNEIPASTLQSPSGKIYESSSVTDKVMYSSEDEALNAYWTLTLPEAGTWELTLQNADELDTLFSFIQPRQPEFNISMSQIGNQVHLTWDKSLFEYGDTLYAVLDDDNSGFNGIPAAKADATTGECIFETGDSLRDCSYYLFAQAFSGHSVFSDYAENRVVIAKNILPAPIITGSHYLPDEELVRIEFEDNNDIHTSGYMLKVLDETGDSTYAIVNKGIGTIDLDIPDYSGKTFQMTAFDYNGFTGCPSPEKGIFLTQTKTEKLPENKNRIFIYPNPTSGKSIIRFTLAESGNCEIRVFDFTGRLAGQPVSAEMPAGTWEKEWDFETLPNGIYFFVLRTKNQVTSTKCILSK